MDQTATCFSRHLWDVQVPEAASSPPLLRGVQVFAPSLRERADTVRLSGVFVSHCQTICGLNCGFKVDVWMVSHVVDQNAQFIFFAT